MAVVYNALKSKKGYKNKVLTNYIQI